MTPLRVFKWMLYLAKQLRADRDSYRKYPEAISKMASNESQTDIVVGATCTAASASKTAVAQDVEATTVDLPRLGPCDVAIFWDYENHWHNPARSSIT